MLQFSADVEWRKAFGYGRQALDVGSGAATPITNSNASTFAARVTRRHALRYAFGHYLGPLGL